MVAQRLVRMRRDADDVRHAEVAGEFQDLQHFDGLAARRERDHDVVLADEAEVAVRRFRRMDEIGRRRS
jgi:hypothetical protein